MAGLICDVNIPESSYTAGVTYNIICGTAPANQRIRIRSLKFAGTANSAQTPGLLQFCNATSGGVTGNPAVVPKPREGENTETPQSIWLALPTTPPTGIVAYNSMEVNPQIGIYESYPDPEGYFIKGGGFWCITFKSQWTGIHSGTLCIEE